MSNSISHISEQDRSLWRTYLTLTKPKVVALMLLTALVGMCLAVQDHYLCNSRFLVCWGLP